MAKEKTFVMIKPDGVKRKLIGEVIKRIENKNFNILAMKYLNPDLTLAKKHYDVHKDKPFFNDLIKFITSGPVVAMVVEGEDAIKQMRACAGATRPVEAKPGTIRGDFAQTVTENIVHCSDSPETAEYEISNFFSQDDFIV